MKNRKIIDVVTAKYAKLCRLNPEVIKPDCVVSEDLCEQLEKAIADVCKVDKQEIANRPKVKTIVDFAELVLRIRYKRQVEAKLLQMCRDVFGFSPEKEDNLRAQWLKSGCCHGKTDCKHFYSAVVLLLGVPRDNKSGVCYRSKSIEKMAEYVAFEIWDMKKSHSLK